MPDETVGDTPQDSGDTTQDTPETKEEAQASSSAPGEGQASAPASDEGVESSGGAEEVSGTAETGEEGPVLDIGSESEPEEYERAAPMIRGHVDKTGAALGTGRRKTAVARVRIRDGNGGISINGRELTQFFPLERDQQMVLAPLKATNTLETVDVTVRVMGGGTTGQTGAVVLGIARALQVRNPDSHHELSDGGFLTRDGRMVERKKYGYKKARRSFQFSKR